MRQIPDQHSKLGNLQENRAINTAGIFCALLILETAYELLVRHISIAESAWLAPFNASIYTLVFITTFRLDLLKLSIVYLAIPYLIFFPGWLNIPTASFMLAVFLYSLYKTLRESTSGICSNTGIREFSAFIVVMAWVNLSGAGGYGYQTFDYTISNGRLLDLVNYSWPVHYDTDKNFIYYAGYFLPSALIGKILGFDVGMRSLYAWTAIGVCIALRWLSQISNWGISAALAVAFLLFGPLDILGDLYLIQTDNISIKEAWQIISANTDNIDFWSSIHSPLFLGNYLSNTFGLYWSPQQVMPGWIFAGMLFYLYTKGRMKHFVFIFSLLCLWAPLVLIAMTPIVIGASVLTVKRDWRSIITTENVIGSGSMALFFAAYYLAGSIEKNPSAWIFLPRGNDTTILMFIFSWGIYGACLLPLARHLEQREKEWLVLLALTAIFLPLRTYGEYSDLLCRGSVPIMFLTLALLLKYFTIQCRENHRFNIALLVVVFSLGTTSAIFQLKTAIKNYGVNQPVASVISYKNAYPNLGNDDNIFQKYLARKIGND